MSNCQREYNRTPLGDSIDVASMKILKKSYELSPKKNLVTSPLGVLTLITLFASTSDGEHDEEIMNLLGSIDHKQFLESYSQLIERFSSMDPNPLIIGNRIMWSKTDTPSEEFCNTVRCYNNEVNNDNFEDEKTAVDAINEWSAKVTKGMINNPVSENDFNPDSVVNFLSVIFFQGHWHVPFNVKNTKEEEFHVNSSTTVMKPMMHLLQPLFYHRNMDMGAKMIELPYKESKFRMIVVLPDDVEGLPAVIEKVSVKGLLGDIFHLRPTKSKVDLSMPKFEIQSKINFNKVLPKGVSSILQRGRPSGQENRPHPPTSRALQEVYIKVNEEGATAGAFTGRVKLLKSMKSEPPTPIPFKVDRPFLYVILHDDIVIFVGTYTR